ncbi:UNVERIFIED_CONTAM: hypothetical protein K2H54_052262 [Gekko kuhli]
MEPSHKVTGSREFCGLSVSKTKLLVLTVANVVAEERLSLRMMLQGRASIAARALRQPLPRRDGPARQHEQAGVKPAQLAASGTGEGSPGLGLAVAAGGGGTGSSAG